MLSCVHLGSCLSKSHPVSESSRKGSDCHGGTPPATHSHLPWVPPPLPSTAVRSPEASVLLPSDWVVPWPGGLPHSSPEVPEAELRPHGRL